MFAAEIRKRRVHHSSYSQWRWHLDEVFVKINGAHEAVFSVSLAPGPYWVRAWLTDASRRFSSTLGVEVR
jgi:hypothetical protein